MDKYVSNTVEKVNFLAIVNQLHLLYKLTGTSGWMQSQNSKVSIEGREGESLMMSFMLHTP